MMWFPWGKRVDEFSLAIRTKDLLYIKNFKPDRWPQLEPPLSQGQRTHGDLDGGPTKEWFYTIQNEPKYASFVDFAWGKRPAEELYDLENDPHEMNSVYSEPKYADLVEELAGEIARLQDELDVPDDPGSVEPNPPSLRR